MNIKEATRSYEEWMNSCGPVVKAHLRDKHVTMREDAFQFLRGSYYRWAQVWKEVCKDCADAPRVLAVGDLHVDSYGTWRDAEGRLCWGVDDFDEAYPLPYTNDLVRLAASVKVARKLGLTGLKTSAACQVIIDGYQKALEDGGCPIVLGESETHLEKLGIEALKTPKCFWEKLNEQPSVGQSLPREVRQALLRGLPERSRFRVIQREAGLGSLGQQRFVAISQYRGGCIAREAKRVVPSASLWLRGQVTCRQSYYKVAMTSAVRSPDPYQQIWKDWLLRRLSPDSNPIKIEELSGKRDEHVLLQAMANEIANVHLGSKRALKPVLRDLTRRKNRWLHDAARNMGQLVIREWKEFKKC
jgi:hypothetical protein